MKSKIYLHIGNHKTGSTVIQKFLYENSEKLNEQDLHYPKVGVPTNPNHFGQHNIAWQLNNDRRFNKDFGDFSELNELFKKKKTLILSSEDFEVLRFGKSYEIFNKIIEKNNYQIKIILVLRKQEDLIVSLLSELATYGVINNNIDLIISKIKKNGYLDFLVWNFWFNYKLEIDQIINLFKVKKTDISIIWYSTTNLLKKFLNLVTEVDPKKIENEIEKYEKLKINRRLTDLSYQMLQHFNKIHKNYNLSSSDTNKIINFLRNPSLFPSKNLELLSEEIKNDIRIFFKDSNSEVTKNFIQN